MATMAALQATGYRDAGLPPKWLAGPPGGTVKGLPQLAAALERATTNERGLLDVAVTAPPCWIQLSPLGHMIVIEVPSKSNGERDNLVEPGAGR